MEGISGAPREAGWGFQVVYAHGTESAKEHGDSLSFPEEGAINYRGGCHTVLEEPPPWCSIRLNQATKLPRLRQLWWLRRRPPEWKRL